METGIAETLGLELGDVMRYDVAGDILEVEISSLREVQWDSFRVNFRQQSYGHGAVQVNIAAKSAG